MIIEVFLFVATLLLWVLYRNRRPPGFPPGPTGLPLVGYYPFLFPNPHIKLQELSKKYGDVIGLQLGQKWVVVMNEHKAIKEALKEEVFSGRPDFLIFLLRSEGHRKGGVILSEGKEWQEQRRFTMKNLRDFGLGKKSMEDLIQLEVQDLVDQFRKHAATGKPVNLRFTFHIAVVNALWSIVTGDKFSPDNPAHSKLAKDLFSSFEGINITLSPDVFFPWLINLFPKQLNIPQIADAMNRINAICNDQMKEHKQSMTDDLPRDFIDVYLKEIQSTSDPHSSFSKENGDFSLRMVLGDLFVAGIETTSNTLYWLFLYLIIYPEVQEKLYKEIVAVIGRDRQPAQEDKTKMPYTEAVILEVLRHSTLILFSVAHTTTADTEFRQFHIPKGTVVIPNLYAAHYNADHWNDPQKFRPERFLTPDGKVVKDEALMPFGIGKRQCLGESLARLELFLFVTGILQNIAVRAAPGEVPTLEPQISFARMAQDYNVTLQER